MTTSTEQTTDKGTKTTSNPVSQAGDRSARIPKDVPCETLEVEMATRGITKSVRRRAGESDASFLQHAASLAAARGMFCRVETEGGPLCQSCAPYGLAEGENYVKLTIGPSCYNCGDKSDMAKMNAAARRLGA